jgi:hypothetical protein
MKPENIILKMAIDLRDMYEKEIDKLMTDLYASDDDFTIEAIETRIDEIGEILDDQSDGHPPKIKFNGGRLALLCNECNTIIDEDFEPDTYDMAELCDRCYHLEE